MDKLKSGNGFVQVQKNITWIPIGFVSFKGKKLASFVYETDEEEQ